MSAVESGSTTSKSRDILASPWRALLVFWLPALAIGVTASSAFGTGWRTAVWTVALVTMGIACLVNARRCGRVHCYMTGPFFLIMALVTLLFGFGALPLGTRGWNLIGLTILAGGIVLCCVPEMLFGRYRKAGA